MITLKLGPARVPPKTLCSACVFSHIVRGYRPEEKIVFCGFAFPLREVLFPVKECTDFRAERQAGLELAVVREA
jgi:hypothetical protein